ncbi:TetR/AcrR family transcriptional regulator [Planctomonas sp. JC2975]|uniref:TetR/AcrR family transcriptional regulator n=1 Tax=Planctomonas sp. JC2975 TaxID=2729626 RepID=UPI0014753C10|nr:TetR/AcrR family transcriptional regulator [Planctomonas sp. JC2975]NNC12864.1 TetR/AcrR family transcriptional regulator [Planctomonas sp. JC2975]
MAEQTRTGSRALRADARRSVEQITRAAIEAFHGRGLDTPMEEIATAAGVAKGTIYHRFGGRAGLVDAVIGELVGSSMHEIGERAEAIDDPWSAFASYVTERRLLHYREPAAIDALVATHPESPELAKLATAATTVTQRLINRAHAAAVLRPGFTVADLYYFDVGNALALRHLGRPTATVYAERTTLFLDSLKNNPADHLTVDR